MTALERLREWFNGDKRPEKSAWITGDTVETRAILELADRPEKLEGKQPIAGSLEQFKITGIGKYRTRSGQTVFVDSFRPDLTWPARGTGSWQMNGKYSIGGREHPLDIVAGPLADEPRQEPEMARLTADLLHVLKGVRPLVLRGTTETLTEDGAIRTTWLGHLDAAITKASAIVKPEPKRETRNIWLVFWEDQEVRVYDRRPHFQFLVAPIAIVEQEITFTHG